VIDVDVLTDATHLSALAEEDRFVLADQIAWNLGSAWEALDSLSGEDRLPGLNHTPTGMQFALVPGGSFDMGMTDSEEAEAVIVIGGDPSRNAAIAAWYAAAARPVRHVEVRPFLCARAHVPWNVAAVLNPGIQEDHEGSVMVPAKDTWMFRDLFPGARLLSEAEWEWTAREGGRERWISADARREPGHPHGRLLDATPSRAENRWGVEQLQSDAGEWVADAWHPDFSGAPSDGEAWEPEERAGVKRGAHAGWLADQEAITMHCAFREQAPEGVIAGVRLAVDLP
jgi:formylglycine-generating enzyme required for sulfatase activity